MTTRLVLAAALAAAAFAPAAHAGPVGDTLRTVRDTAGPVLDQVPPVCVVQPLPEPVPFGQVQVGYCP